MEIEKKFLVKSIPENIGSYTKKRIRQAYISVSPVIRLRQSDEEYYLTVKGKGYMVREEFEIEITRQEYERLMLKAESKTIEKDRYLIPIAEGLIAELDIYLGYLEGLYTVEVEFETEALCNSFVPPCWFGRDVTMDKCYKNSSLSMQS